LPASPCIFFERVSIYIDVLCACRVPIPSLHAMQTMHIITQILLLCVGIVLTFDSHLQPVEHYHLVGLILNLTLLALSLMLDVAMNKCIAKRMMLWLLYYEFITPLVFIFIYMIRTRSEIPTIVLFFAFYTCLPLLYFTHLTQESIMEFMHDTPQHASV